MNWFQCGLPNNILQVLTDKLQFKCMFPIQSQSIPILFSGRDLIGIAQTGSGKTLAYLLPLLRHVIQQDPVQAGQGPIGLIMAPTRQLAQQINQSLKSFTKHLRVRGALVYGGINVQSQIQTLKKGVEVVICTPGRLIDMLTMSNGKITNLKRVTFVVIDEADRMFDLGFEPQITKIMSVVRPDRQTAMFSATFPKNVQLLARKLLHKPIQVIVGSRGKACATIKQIVQVRQQSTKFLRLLQLLGQWHQKGKILIFVDKQTQADHLFRQLLAYGYSSLVLHGGMDPQDRQYTIYDFRRGIRGIKVLVATSVCSRGLDIKDIVLVVNFSCPNHMQDYIHRIGRTGRAGIQGTAITFITNNQQHLVHDIVKALNLSLAQIPQPLQKMYQRFMNKVQLGDAKIYRNKHMQGQGFKFDVQQQQNQHKKRKVLKKQFQYQQGALQQDSQDQDIFVKKAIQEARRGGKSNQQKLLQLMKDPQSKQRLLSQAGRKANDAIKQGMSQQQVIQMTQKLIKQALQTNRFKVIRNITQGIDHVTKIVRQVQRKKDIQVIDYDFQINDYPTYARQKVCNSQYLYNIGLITNTTVRMRGTYIDPSKKHLANDRPLFLHIQGQSKYQVQNAYKQIKRYIQEVSFANMSGNRRLAIC